MSSLLTLSNFFLIKKPSPLLHYVKGNTSRFGSAIQVLPNDIREYFKLSFIIAVVVFIVFDLFFSLLYSEITLCNVFYFCYSKNVFFNYCRTLFVRNKVLLTLFTYLTSYLYEKRYVIKNDKRD